MRYGSLIPWVLMLCSPLAAGDGRAFGAGRSESRSQGGIGAQVPWLRFEAEQMRTNGRVEGPSRRHLTPEAEASGRRLVRLACPGDYVEWRLDSDADGLVVRHCIPDSTGGTGRTGLLEVEVNGRTVAHLTLSSRLTWVYGDFPWTNRPEDGRAHAFWDESRLVIPGMRAGDHVRLVRPAGDALEWVLLDLVELEPVPPAIAQPAGSLSLLDFGADPGGSVNSSDALESGLARARSEGRTLWVPPGRYLISGDALPLGGVRLLGAGVWHSILVAERALFTGTGERFEVAHLSLTGSVDRRDDASADNAFNGNLGDGSILRDLWIEHFKCGIWTLNGTRSLRVERCRIRNTLADGINLCDGTSDSGVSECHLRNTGDDALATWSPSGDWSSGRACRSNRFLRNTIELPWMANGIGVYGGSGHRVEGNLLISTVQSGGGIHLSSAHGAVPFSGTLTVRRNRIEDAGGDCYIGESVGALWIHARDSDITARIRISDLTVVGGANGAVTLHGSRAVENLELRRIHLVKAP